MARPRCYNALTGRLPILERCLVFSRLVIHERASRSLLQVSRVVITIFGLYGNLYSTYYVLVQGGLIWYGTHL